MSTLWITQQQYNEALKGAYQMYKMAMPAFEIPLKPLDDVDTIQVSLGSKPHLPRYKRFKLRFCLVGDGFELVTPIQVVDEWLAREMQSL